MYRGGVGTFKKSFCFLGGGVVLEFGFDPYSTTSVLLYKNYTKVEKKFYPTTSVLPYDFPVKVSI
jgi:hypothetical protein